MEEIERLLGGGERRLGGGSGLVGEKKRPAKAGQENDHEPEASRGASESYLAGGRLGSKLLCSAVRAARTREQASRRELRMTANLGGVPIGYPQLLSLESELMI